MSTSIICYLPLSTTKYLAPKMTVDELLKCSSLEIKEISMLVECKNYILKAATYASCNKSCANTSLLSFQSFFFFIFQRRVRT